MNLIVNACMDIGCICGLTLAGISNLNGVSHRAWFKREGKTRHASLVWARSYSEFIFDFESRLPGSWSSGVPLFFVSTFCLKTAPGMWTCVGEISQAYHRHTHHTCVAQHRLCFHDMGQGKLERSVCPMGQLNHHWSSLFLIFCRSDGMCTLYLTLFDSWVWMW
jgi:hypothetical protein